MLATRAFISSLRWSVAGGDLTGSPPTDVSATWSGVMVGTPATGTAASAGPASETAPPAPVAPNAQETDGPQQFAEAESRNEGSWIVIAVVLLLVLTVLGVGLAALGLSGD